ncbi:universal stress protein [Nocardioides rubriscoriae]|uniref:universal stress protein n=1 Tax=Nocardioides rubriscoriae TaxID=642762 RepID=UPI0011DFC58A|nr:universal stress protein [Nocardioides rubriscoriae]
MPAHLTPTHRTEADARYLEESLAALELVAPLSHAGSWFARSGEVRELARRADAFQEELARTLTALAGPGGRPAPWQPRALAPTHAPSDRRVVAALEAHARGSAEQALDWATDEAALEHRALVLVYSVRLTTSSDAMLFGQPAVDMTVILEDLRIAGHKMLADARRRAQARAPGLVVHEILTRVDPRTALLELGERAAAVVVGSRGRGPIATALLGSVSVHLAKHATCPVVVVRHAPGAAARGGVVVDVDDTEQGRAAIEFAYLTASFRRLPLTALRVVWDPTHVGADHRVVRDEDPGLDTERLLLSEATAGMREKFPDVADRLELVRGRREHQLARASRGAELLVVGSAPNGPVEHLARGSVATVVEHAACDVAVLPRRPVH